jgi:DNA polymerase-3 subunit delta
MPTLSGSALLKALARPEASGVFFLHGDEDYLKEQAISRIVEAYLDPATRDFNFDQVRGTDISGDDLASLLATPPMMAEYRVTVVRDAQGLSAKARELIERVASAPGPGLILVLAATIPSGSRAKFYDVMKKQAASVEFGSVDAVDLPGWLIDMARESHGLELEPEAARGLASATGAQLGVLSAELDKLAAYVEGRPTITLEDVQAVVGYIPRVDRWAWFDLVGDRHMGEALRQLPTLLESGETAVGLVIGMTSQILRIGIAAAGGKSAIEKQLKPYQRWLSGRILTQSRGWTVGDVDTALLELLRTDRLLKSASLTDRQAMDELILRLEDHRASRRTAA